jgi:tryptophan-rich sensory protein
MKKWQSVALWICISEAVGISGAIFTSAAIPSWYALLNKPSFSPPNWLFGPVWTILYVMMGTAMGLFVSTKTKFRKQRASGFFVIQLLLNFLWSVVFFGLRQPLWALGEIVMLWIAIVLCIQSFWKVNRIAGYLMLPYLLWVSFASILNFAIVVLN